MINNLCVLSLLSVKREFLLSFCADTTGCVRVVNIKMLKTDNSFFGFHNNDNNEDDSISNKKIMKVTLTYCIGAY